ncbi:MAG: MBL fold metallo-hydrolase [Rhodobacterales bacterium]|nr:MBL fold metallo-hydrolase [Rhodobacterales bacterium]
MTTRRQFLGTIPATGAAFAIGGNFIMEPSPARAEGTPPVAPGHFHPKGKAPSEHTIAVLKAAKEQLPFADTRDFEEFNKGLIARRSDLIIPSDAGGVAWDMERFLFIDQAEEFDTVHPSMHRIAQLNQNFGLYEVIPGIYQVRGFDLSQATFVRSKTGWILFDVLTTAEPMRAAWELFQQHVGEGLPVKAVVYSHNHGDHWGGVRGVITDEDVSSGRVEVIAPVGFMNNLVAENVYAGNAMNRRLFYQYGILLPVSPYGFVTQGLGPTVSNGTPGLIAPTRIVSEAIEEIEIDGLKLVFQNTPNTEAPSEMNTWIPEYKTLWMAENINATLHNIYTLRGAPVRDPLRWSKYINEALYLFGQEAEVMIASHHWPRWGNERIQEVLRGQRDIYAHMNNQVMHLANQGVTINQIHNVYKVPQSLQDKWYARGYHGSPEHNSRGVVQRFLGFWDCNPATLIPLSPADSAPLYVEMMGGAAPIMAKGRALHDAGDYLLAIEILNKLVQAEPDNLDARDMLADAFEQVGYQQENPGLRNSFLSGAFELRSGIPTGDRASSSSPDIVRAMSAELWLNFLGIMMDSTKAEGLSFKINLRLPDIGEQFIIEMANATLTNIQGFLAPDPDLTITLNRSDLEGVMMGETGFEGLIASGAAVVEGDLAILGTLAGLMVQFDPLFEVMPGTAPAPAIDSVFSDSLDVKFGAPPPE